MERARRHAAAAILGAGLLAAILADADLLAAGAASADGAGEKALRGGFVEEESVRLILLDVVVKDEEGSPVPGLSKEDFDLRLDWKRWPIYSLDDLCAAGAGRESSAAGEEGGDPAGPAAPTPDGAAQGRVPAASNAGDRMRFVLYFDFSQLRLASRRQAIRAAIRWVEEVKKPFEEAMIEAYVSKSGLRTLVPFTRDAGALRAALEKALDDKTLIDGFGDQFEARVDECVKCIVEKLCPNCMACVCEPNAFAEYEHGRRALEALRRFMVELDLEPGRKSVIFMHQNTSLSPGEFYYVPKPEFRIGMHRPLLEAIAAEATSSRAALYTAHFGDNLLSLGADQAIGVGYELASYTGGASSRASYVSFDLMKRAGREGSCTYRIGFEPPGEPASRVHDVVVKAAGRRLPADYRVRFVGEADRLMRRAQLALRDPAAHGEISVSAALVPRATGGKRWNASVQVAIDAATLGLLPSGDVEEGHLDVGALLVNEKSGQTWEMLAGSEIRRGRDGSGRAVLMYETGLERLAPGPYRLRAFAHDKALDLYGAAEASLVLPSGDGVVGPLAACPHRAVFASDLPLRGEAAAAGARVEARRGLAPFAGGKLARGERLSIDSWICSEASVAPGVNLIRLVERQGEILFRLPEGWTHAEGRCQRFTDLLDTIELSPGDYAYRLIWNPAGAMIPVSRTLEFSVGPGAPRLARDASSR